MSKKDRIAIVVSGLYFLFPLAALLEATRNAGFGFVVLTVPLILYWGYRFIKNDISFMSNKEDSNG
ncbi:MAG: hypothetical protein U9Q30_00085 [Campylobacterota bacterium]|nr:hypothetical protein [Campylobacterota bacterium]